MFSKQIATIIVAAGLFIAGFLLGSASGITHIFAAPSAQQSTTTPKPGTCAPGHGALGKLFGGQRPVTGGIVQNVSGSTIQLTTRGGATVTVTISPSTTYSTLGGSASLADIHSGVTIAVVGSASGTNAYTATKIVILPAHAAGTVSAINGNTITITPGAGRLGQTSTATTIVTTGSTKYFMPGQSSAGLSNIQVGSRIMAIGTLSADGKTLTAKGILIAPAGMLQPGGLFGFRGIFRFRSQWQNPPVTFGS